MGKRRPVRQQTVYLKNKIPLGSLINFKPNNEFYVITDYVVVGYHEKHQALEQNTGIIRAYEDFGEENVDYEIIK